jgi:AcrR family transcriptional regulator
MQKRAVETKKRILETATRLFAEHGLKGTTVDRIAAEAGVNKQRIYAYFGSKEKLFVSSLGHVFEEAAPVSQNMLDAAGRASEHLTETLLRGFHNFHAANPQFWRLLAWANLEDARLLDGLRNVRTREDGEIRRLFDRAQAEGKMKPISFDSYLFTLLAVSWFMRSNALTLRYTLGHPPVDENASGSLFRELDEIFSRRS